MASLIPTWIADRAVSGLHAAAALCQGHSLTTTDLSQALREPVEALAAALRGTRLPPRCFFDHVLPLSAGSTSPRELVQRVLQKTIAGDRPTDPFVSQMTAAIVALDRAYAAARPKILDDLELRSGPLREQWEARGPGLLAGIARRTEPGLIVEQATIYLVEPVLGGAGRAHIPYNAVSFEALLANPLAELPETVRLAWLLAQLNLDLPVYSEGLPRVSAAWIQSLAMIPPVLEAAADVELVRDDPALRGRAIEAWSVVEDQGLVARPAADVATTLDTWWQTYCETKSTWRVALAALAEMLGNSG